MVIDGMRCLSSPVGGGGGGGGTEEEEDDDDRWSSITSTSSPTMIALSALGLALLIPSSP